MGLLGTLSRDPVKSTAAWAELMFRKVTRGNHALARDDMKSILNTMVSARANTPSEVLKAITDEEVSNLSELCVAILASEAISIDPADIPEMLRKSKHHLLKNGVPMEFV